MGGRHRPAGAEFADDLAQERLRAALTAADSGLRPVARCVTVAAYLRARLALSVTERNRPRTIASYTQTVDRYIVPSIGGIALSKLEPEDVSRMIREVRRRGVSVTTARYAAAVLRIALGPARKERRVIHNVVDLVDLPKPQPKEFTPLSADQARALVESVSGHPFGPLFTLAIATGMRQGELLGLRWQNVDLDGGYLHVRQAPSTGHSGARRDQDRTEPTNAGTVRSGCGCSS